jgi:putative FmdB family regulatory protein
MPTYEYACTGCQHRFEEWQSFKDETLTTCPKCKKKKLQRLISGGAAIIFKGSGFYETDYRQKDEAKKAGKSTDNDTAAAETAQSTDTKADSASKTEAPKKAEPKAAESSKPTKKDK